MSKQERLEYRPSTPFKPIFPVGSHCSREAGIATGENTELWGISDRQAQGHTVPQGLASEPNPGLQTSDSMCYLPKCAEGFVTALRDLKLS